MGGLWCPRRAPTSAMRTWPGRLARVGRRRVRRPGEARCALSRSRSSSLPRRCSGSCRDPRRRRPRSPPRVPAPRHSPPRHPPPRHQPRTSWWRFAGPVPSASRLTPARLRKVRAAIRAQARALGVTALSTYVSDTRAFSTRITAADRVRLERDPAVLEVIDDDLVEGMSDVEDSGSKIIGRPTSEQLSHQVTPTWLKRIGVLAVDRRLGKGKRRRAFDADVAIIDSGISHTHPDIRPAGGKDCTHSGGWGDGYGHGLGVASILGARDNHRGTVGILPGVRVWSVRIFDSKGRARLSWVLCGLDWVASQRDPHHRHRPLFEGATLSFSLGGSSRGFIANRNCGHRPLDLVHQAVCRIERQGTIVVAAAGNYDQKARHPTTSGVSRGHHGLGDGRLRRQARRQGTAIAGVRARVRTGAGRPVRLVLVIWGRGRPHRPRQVHLGRLARQVVRARVGNLVRGAHGAWGGAAIPPAATRMPARTRSDRRSSTPVGMTGGPAPTRTGCTSRASMCVTSPHRPPSGMGDRHAGPSCAAATRCG